MSKRAAAVLVIVFFGLGLVGCNDDDNPVLATPRSSPASGEFTFSWTPTDDPCGIADPVTTEDVRITPDLGNSLVEVVGEDEDSFCVPENVPIRFDGGLQAWVVEFTSSEEDEILPGCVYDVNVAFNAVLLTSAPTGTEIGTVGGLVSGVDCPDLNGCVMEYDVAATRCNGCVDCP